MYKKILLSLILVVSIVSSPVAEAKGANIPIISTVVETAIAVVEDAVSITIDLVESIPIVGPIIIESYNLIGDVVGGVVTIVDCVTSPFECIDKDSPSSGSNLSIPSKPLNVSVSNKYEDGSFINHGFIISWDAPESLGGAASVGYRIYRGTSQSSLGTLITTTEMDNGQKSFIENRIQDPTSPFYYKVVAFNAKGESVGDIVKAPIDIRYLTDTMTLVGAGFKDDTKVYLKNNGNSILCSGFTAPDSRTLTGGVCDITTAPTGNWTVRIVSSNDEYSECVDCFRIALPEPVSPSVSISKIDLSDGVFKIDSIAGDNLYTGATVRVVANNQKLDCFSLSAFNYKTNNFSGGQCNVDSFKAFLNILGFTSDSDISKLSVEIVNDSNSAPVIPSNVPTFTCTSTSYSPDAATVCGISPITQYSNCGVKKTAMPTLICSSGKTCKDGACVGCTPEAMSTTCYATTINNIDRKYCDGRQVNNNCGTAITCDVSVCSSGQSCLNAICQ